MEFKYKANFSCASTFNFGKWKEARAKRQVFASSLEDLRSLLPSDEEILDNPDLLYTSFNVAVVNLINANDHGIGTDTALAISKYFINRHANIDHSRWDVIGHVISQGFSTFGENKMIEAKDLVGYTEPFNICLGAVVYKIVREYMAEIIKESSDKDSEYHEYISTSWEVGFNDFDIVLGSKKISDATIISDKEKVAELSQYLKMEGGDGFMPDGTPVYCLIKGDARPLGFGFTSSPAAAVKGVFTPEIKDDEEDPDRGSKASDENVISISLEELEKRISEATSKALEAAESLRLQESKASELENVGENKENIANINKNNSQKKKITVNKNMKLKSIDEITPEFLQTAEASEIRDFIKLELESAAKEFSEKVETSSKEKEVVETDLTATKENLSSLQKELEELKKQVEAKQKQEDFDVRMEEVSSAFELNEAQTKVIAAKIKGFTADEYSAWKTESDLFLPKKSAVASTSESKEDEAEKALKAAEASEKTNIPNSAAPETDNLKKLVDSLKSAITIK